MGSGDGAVVPEIVYLDFCPRCRGKVEIGEEHETMYRFSCSCGGGKVATSFGAIDPANRANVYSIAWDKPAPIMPNRW